MKFQLTGKIIWSVGSCHEDRRMTIREEFEAPNIKMAIEKAKNIVQTHHEKFCHSTDYGLTAELRTISPVWITFFCGDQPAIPAQPARSAIAAHFQEERLA